MKKFIFYASTLVFSFNILSNHHDAKQETMQIKPIEVHQAHAVKQMILYSAHELWQLDYPIEQLEQELDAVNEFEDLVDVRASYLDNGGLFLVLLDNERVVGAGAIRKANDETCELMRLWFYKEYRGKGFGSKIVNQLLEFAREKRYKKIRLDVYRPEIQTHAVALYKKLGFYEIPAYNNYPAKLWMEKVL